MGARLLIFDKLSARHAYSMGHDYLIGKSKYFMKVLDMYDEMLVNLSIEYLSPI